MARFLEAAIAVLETSNKPLTLREIVAEAIGRGLIEPAGKTPEATMSARLYVYVRDDPNARVVRVADPGAARARRGSVRWTLRNHTPDTRRITRSRRRSGNG